MMIQRGLYFIVFVMLTVASHAQFRTLNSAFHTSVENPAFIVSPMDYNKISLVGSGVETMSLYGQGNINRLYSAVGGQVTRFGTNDVSFSLRAASHSLMTRNNYHVALGGEVSYFNGLSNHLSWTLGVMATGRQVGRFAFGLTYTNFEYVAGTFSSDLRRQADVVSGFGAYSIPLTRKIKLTQTINYKSMLNGNSRLGVAHYGVSLLGRGWVVGSGIRKYDALHYAGFIRLGLYYKRFMLGYVGFLDQQHLSLNKWTNELSLVIKL